MNRGYVKLWRKSLDSGFLGNADVWQLLSWCLLNATHKPHKQLVGKQLVDLAPGQLIFGRVSAAAKLNSSEKKIRNSLKLLENANFLTVKRTSKFSIVSIVNWDTYQEEGPARGQQKGQHEGQQGASKGPARGHKQEQENKRTKEDNKHTSSKINNSSGNEAPFSGVGGREESAPPPVLDEPPIEFQELRSAWDNYARSEEPLSGLDEYWQLKHSKQWPGNGRIMAAMERLKEQDQQWIRGFVPGLAKFLRLRGWLKEPDTKARSPSTGGKSSPDEVLDYNARTSQKILEERRARASAENHCP